MEVVSPAEAVRGLCHQLPGFEESLREGEYRVTKTYEKSEEVIDEDGLLISFGSATGFRIEPVVGGHKRGMGKLILGAIIVGVAFIATGGAAAGASGLAAEAFAIGGASVTWGNIAFMGGMMMLQGVSSLLAPTPKAPETEDQQDSFLLDATGNLTQQGNPVPIVFGEVFTGSVMISAGLSVEEVKMEVEDPHNPNPPDQGDLAENEVLFEGEVYTDVGSGRYRKKGGLASGYYIKDPDDPEKLIRTSYDA